MRNSNINAIKEDLEALEWAIEERVDHESPLEEILTEFAVFEDIPPSPYADLIREHSMTVEERIALLMAIAPHFMPKVFDIFYKPEDHPDLSYSRIGGRNSTKTRVFLPTGRMVLFVLGEEWHYSDMFGPDHFFKRNNILSLAPVSEGVPFIDGVLTISDEYLRYLDTGQYEPRYGENFPAKKATTELNWEDLVIRPETMSQVSEIKGWIKHERAILENPVLKRKIRRGYRALFYGRSGTGKTLTATLLGKTFDMPIYRVDLSMVVSKYVGETEKNLEKIFNMAESRGWILFFDEAEALFGKRSSGGTANDRYANQEVSYLLQRIEDYDGILILSSNKLFDIDEAFTRRFQSIIEFPEPNAEERLVLWKKTFENTGFEMGEDLDIRKLAESHAITGGMLVNVLRFSAIRVMERGNNVIIQDDLIAGLKKEYAKERKMWVEVPVKTTVSRVQVKGTVN